MARRVKPFNKGDDIKAQNVVLLLRDALRAAQQLQAPKLARRLRLAISTAKGAVRNVEYRRIHAELEMPRDATYSPTAEEQAGVTGAVSFPGLLGAEELAVRQGFKKRGRHA